MSKVIAIIPARWASTRLPGKPLADINGKPMIQRVYEAVKKSNVDEVLVATDDKRIFEAVSKFGNVLMTSPNHQTGTDRILEAYQMFKDRYEYVINVQGDEPFIDKSSLSKLVNLFKNDIQKEIDLASLMVELKDVEQVENPNNVKVIVDPNDFALYFSRSPIPYHRDTEIDVTYYKHVGVYAFRKEALTQFYHTPVTPLEAAEKIEAIRYSEMGKKIIKHVFTKLLEQEE